MFRNWTFGYKIGAGFALTVTLALVIGATSIYSLRAVVSAKDQVISVNAQNITDGERLAVASARGVAAVRGYLLGKQDQHLDELRERREAFKAILARLHEQVRDPDGRRALDEIERKESEYRAASDGVIAMRKGDTAMELIVRRFDDELLPKRNL